MLAPVLFLLSAMTFSATEPTEVLLWPEGAPGSEGKEEIEEQTVLFENAAVGSYTRLSQVHRPSLTVYPASKESANGAAVIIAPGGGFRFLSIDLEGSEVAAWLNGIGVTAAVLKYRLSREEGSAYSIDDSVADALQAVRVLRDLAPEWEIDPDRIGLMGFSAGGVIAARASLEFDEPEARPDLQILVYGFETQETLPVDTPPAFLICAHDDGNKPEQAIEAYRALLARGVSAELHIYAEGGHAYAMRDLGRPVHRWKDRLAEWLNDQGWLESRAAN